MFTKSVHLIEVKNRIFKMILGLSCVAFAAISVVNILNNRPIINFIVPIMGAIIAGLLLMLFWKQKYTRIIKYGYMLFLCIL